MTDRRYEGEEELKTWFQPTEMEENNDTSEQKMTNLSSVRLFLHSWQVWLQREEPQKVGSLSPGSSTFRYGDANTDLGQLLAY